MLSFWQDLRFAARTLRKNPGFTLAALTILTLGIGGNIGIFTVTSAVLLRPLPYRDPQQLLLLDIQEKDGQSHCCNLNWFDLVHQRGRSFSNVVAVANDDFNLTGRGEPQQVPAGRVSPELFDMLGVKPHLGRSFVPEEGTPEGNRVVMISDSLWHTRFGGDPSIVGQTLTLDSTPYTIIGVLPADVQFPFMQPADVWTPRYFEHTLFTTQRLRLGVGYLTVLARLRPDVPPNQALSEMEVLEQQYRKDNPAAPDADPGFSVVLTNLQDSVVANLRPRLLVLSGAVAVLLLIACANVASLLLSRALGRRKEIAVRAALGAKRGVVIRQLLTESVLLATLAGALGLALGWTLARSLVALGQSSAGDSGLQTIPVSIDSSVLFFTLVVSLLTGVLFGIFPALQLARTDINSTLRDEGRGATGGHSRAQLKSLLVVGQVSLTVLLLIGASLLVRSFQKLLTVNAGFDPRNVLTMNVSLPTVKYADAQKQIAFFDELLRRVSALPGVQSAATSASLPLTPKRISPALPEGQPEVPLASRPFFLIEATSPRLLETLRVPLRSGRAFTEADNAQAPKVIIVNETVARRYWPGQNPIGKHILIGRQPAPAEIVGVAADTKNRGLAVDPQALIYLPFPQLPWGNMNLIVRTSTEPHQMTSAVRAQIAALDPDQPVTAIRTVDELMDSSRSQPRFLMFLLGAFSATALVLAAVGIYGVLAYTVKQRWQELGIRLALGAEKSDILRLVVRQGLTLTIAGIILGLILSLILTLSFRAAVSSLLYKVSVYDLTTFAVVPVLFLIIAFAASYLPALRATAVDPTEALRHE
jgi:putative ABC transport system permease protein